MLDFDEDDVKDMTELSEKEALEFLRVGEVVICQVHPREFLELNTKSDLKQCKRLEQENIYDSLKLFLEN